MWDFDSELPPDPAVLLRSLRGIGYSLEDAVADIIDNSLSARAERVDVKIRLAGADTIIDFIDNGDGLDRDALQIALQLGAKERDPGLQRRLDDLGRFGLGLKTASFSVARRLVLYSRQGAWSGGGAWDLDDVAQSRRWKLSQLTNDEQAELAAALENCVHGTIVRWAKTDRLGLPSTPNRTALIARLQARLSKHLGMVYHRFIDGRDADGLEIQRLILRVNGRPVGPWNPLVPLVARPELVTLGEVRVAPGLRTEYAVLPPDVSLTPEERRQMNLDGRRTSDMQGFYVYRGDRLVCFGSWLGLPGAGSGRWHKEASTQLARIAVDITNASDDEWSLDVRKSRVVPPERSRQVLVEVGTEARAHSRRRIFGRTSTASSGRASHGANEPPLPLWELENGRPRINRNHPLVAAISAPGNGEAAPVRAAVRSLLRQLETSPSLVSLISEPSSQPEADIEAVLDDVDVAEAVDLARCVLRGSNSMETALQVLQFDPRYRNDQSLLERVRQQLERA